MASHQINFGDNWQLSFWRELRPKRAKYQLKLILHPQKGLIVRHAPYVSLSQTQHFLLSNREWIEKKLKQPKPIKPAFSTEHFYLKFLGRTLPVVFCASTRQEIKIHLDSPHIQIFLSQDYLSLLENPVHPDFEQIKNTLKKAIEAWYKSQAHLTLPRLLHECAKQCYWVNTEPSLVIKIQKTRWGSCSNQGNINLNASLMQFEHATIKNVIFHELCHLQHMNHGPDFYQLLTSVDPLWKQHNQILKKSRSELVP